jgi:putative endonuclease
VADDPRRRLGAKGELLAARHLEARGFELVERNFRTRFGELDIVARSSRFLVFCEVKTRMVRGAAGAAGTAGAAGAAGAAGERGERGECGASGAGPSAPANPLGPFASIGPRKQRQVRAMAREWLAAGRFEGPRPPEIRFDAIGISFDARGRLLSLEHLEAAF